MLPRKYRVGKHLGQEIFARGKIEQGQYLYMKFLPSFGPSKFSVVVPKKVSRTSVGRHRIKRQINHALVSSLKDIPKGYVGLIFAKKEAVNKEYKELYEDVWNIIKRLEK